MVGGTHRHRVDTLVQGIQHLAEVGEFFGPRIQLGRTVEPLFVDVADGHHLTELGRIGRITAALAADADAGHGNPLVG